MSDFIVHFYPFLKLLLFSPFFFFKLGADDGKHPDSAKFCNWAKKNCPRVFDGIHHWVARTLLSKGCLQRAVVKVSNFESLL